MVGASLRALLRISSEMKRTSPVFIVGEARSGTSILYRTLQKHSSFRPRTPSLVETDIFVHLRRTFMFGPRYPEALLRYMLGDRQAYDAFLHSITAARVVSAVSAGVNFVVRDRLAWLWYVNLNHLVLRSYFFHAARARGCRRLVEKTPTNWRYLDRLVGAFPRARLLYIHRHPIDVYASYRRRAAVDPHAGWADLAWQEFTVRYEASSRRILQWRVQGHRNLHLVRYEDFVREPALTFRGICEFLGEPFEPSAVEEPAPDLARWRVDPHLWGTIVESTKRWQDYVEPTEAASIQRRLASTMQALGYRAYGV